MAEQKIKLVIVEDNTFGYINPDNPLNFYVLSAMTTRGSRYFNYNHNYGPYALPPDHTLVRLEDFETYRIQDTQYTHRPDEYEWDSPLKLGDRYAWTHNAEEHDVCKEHTTEDLIALIDVFKGGRVYKTR